MPKVIEAMVSLDKAFQQLSVSDHQQKHCDKEVTKFYRDQFLSRLQKSMATEKTEDQYYPSDYRARFLQYHYIVKNPNPTGAKEALNAADDGSTYSAAHKKYHPILKKFLKKFGYYDLFLIEVKTGHIVYSVFKETDFGTSLLKGPYSDSGLAKAFAMARMSDWRDAVFLADFTPYEPSYGAPAAFVAAPIFDGKSLIGVLAAQVSIDEIDNIMTGERQWEKEGMGHTGEAYIVGSDYTMRNDFRFFLENPQAFYSTLKKK